MRLSTLVTTLSVTLVFSACSKKDKDKSGESPGSAPTATTIAALPAIDSAKANALWELAPDDAIMGAVVLPGTGTRLQASFAEIVKVAEARPFGAKLIADLRAKAADEDINIFDPETFKKVGIDLELGAAMFMANKDVSYAIAPVSDRVAFRKLTGATVETIDGMEVDKHDDDFFCTQKERYVCASSTALLKNFGAKGNGSFAKRVAGLPALYRGDAEFVIDIAALEKIEEMKPESEFYEFFSNPGLGVMAMRVGNGAFTLRGWMQATPKGKLEGADSVPTTLATAAAADKANAIYSMRVPAAAWADALSKEDQVLPGGISMQKDVLGNLTGEFVAYTPAKDKLSGTLSFGIKDPVPFKKLLNLGCGMAGGLVQGVNATPGDGVCTATVDVAKLPLPDLSIAAMFPEPIEIHAEVTSDRVAIRIGKDGTLLKGAKVGTLGTDLMENKWNFSIWSEGISVAKDNSIKWNSMPDLPPEALAGIKLGVWMLAHVYELGMAGAIRSDGVHGVMHVGTYAGDAPEAYAAYQAAATLSLDSGGADEAYAELAKKWPGTMAGHTGATGGSVLVAGITGVIAAVAVPAFTKYIERSKEMQREFEAMEDDGDGVPGGILGDEIPTEMQNLKPETPKTKQ